MKYLFLLFGTFFIAAAVLPQWAKAPRAAKRKTKAAKPTEAVEQKKTLGESESIPPVPREAARPVLMEYGVSLGFQPQNNESLGNAQSFTEAHFLRESETAYIGSGPHFQKDSRAYLLTPGFYAGCAIPWERLGFLQKNYNLSLLFGVEGSFLLPTNLLSSEGSFRYLNSQAPHLALTDLTYQGRLTVTQSAAVLTPLLGIGWSYTNATLMRWNESSLQVRLAVGTGFANAKREYFLDLAPQYVSAGAYSDTYQIHGAATQSYSMAVLAVLRADAGWRMRLAEKIFITFFFSGTFYYGKPSYRTLGSFSERTVSGVGKVVHQNMLTQPVDETYSVFIPSIFLALGYVL